MKVESVLLVGSSLEQKTAEPILKQVQNYAAHCQRVGGSSSCDVASLRLLRLKSSAPCPKMQAFFGGHCQFRHSRTCFFWTKKDYHILKIKVKFICFCTHLFLLKSKFVKPKNIDSFLQKKLKLIKLTKKHAISRVFINFLLNYYIFTIS